VQNTYNFETGFMAAILQRTHILTRKQSQPAGTSAKAKLFARWRHHLRFVSGSLMPQWKQW